MIKLSPMQLRDAIRRPIFTTDDAVELTGVDVFTLRNWLKRDVFAVGVKDARGRWSFTTVDLVRISAMVDLAESVGMAPANAAPLGDATVEFLDWFVARAVENREIGLRESPLLAPLDQYFLIAVIHKGKVSSALAVHADGTFVFGDEEDQDRMTALLAVTHVTLASGLIIEDIIEKVAARLEQELGK